MAKHAWIVGCLLVLSLSWPGPALPQTASPQSLAAAKELMVAARLTEQVKLMLPTIMDQLKPLIVRGNPQAERDFELLTPMMLTAMNGHLDAFAEKGAAVYARHFTVEELRQITAFYRTPAGGKFVQKQPVILQENVAIAQEFAQAVAKESQARMTEELRKRGHKL